MNRTHNKSRSVVVERFIKTSKGKFYKKATECNIRSYLDYLDKLVGEYNNTYHGAIGRNSISADYSALTKAPTFVAISSW